MERQRNWTEMEQYVVPDCSGLGVLNERIQANYQSELYMQEYRWEKK